eukprot:m.524478 g.524478  ORF g.524478 m.524478 type:complete len:294 (+) comp21988_c0_seq8:289-1170(+)
MAMRRISRASAKAIACLRQTTLCRGAVTNTSAICYRQWKERATQPWSPHRSRCSSGSTEGSKKDDVKEAVFLAAMARVATTGWTDETMRLAATDVGLPSVAHSVLPGGAVGLVQAFIADCNTQLRQYHVANPDAFSGDGSGDYATVLRAVVRHRLGMLVPYVDTWPQAIAALAQQNNPANAISLLHDTVTEIVEVADKSVAPPTTTTPGTPRVGMPLVQRPHGLALTAIYPATELYLLQDGSAACLDNAMGFFDRRWQDLDALPFKVSPEVMSILGGIAAVGKNVLGVPQKRT